MGGRGSKSSNRDTGRAPEVPLSRRDDALIGMMSQALGLSADQQDRWRDNVRADQTARAEGYRAPDSVDSSSSNGELRAYYSNRINGSLRDSRAIEDLLTEAPIGTSMLLADGTRIRKISGQEGGLADDTWSQSNIRNARFRERAHTTAGARRAIQQAGGLKEWNGRSYVTPGRG